jgi:hypothetical protein
MKRLTSAKFRSIFWTCASTTALAGITFLTVPWLSSCLGEGSDSAEPDDDDDDDDDDDSGDDTDPNSDDDDDSNGEDSGTTGGEGEDSTAEESDDASTGDNQENSESSGDSDQTETNDSSTTTETTDSTGTTDTNTNEDGGDEDWPIATKIAPSFDPPGGLKPEQVPQFIVLGFDDNRYTDGMKWVLDTFESYSNPKGKGNPKTFDGQSAKVSFYFTTDSLEMGEAGLAEQWLRVQANRHEIGNHTHTHRANEETMAWSWTDEIKQSNGTLAELFNLEEKEILGIRAPFLQHDALLFDAMAESAGLFYDVSITHTPSGDMHEDWKFKRHIWPYTLDDDFYFNTSFTSYGKRPGVWTVPVYTLPRGGTKPDRFDTDVSGKFLAGFDSTAYGTLKMSANDFLNSMKWGLEFAMENGSNRAPITIGVHSDTYSEKHHAYDDVASLAERRKAITDFLDYAMTFPEVRIVTSKQLMQWMSNPEPL